MNSKIMASMLLIGLVALSAVGGTWAYFTDTEQSLDNIFTAGVIDLQVDATTLDENGDHVILFGLQDDDAMTNDTSNVSLPKFFNFCSVPDHDIKPGQCGEVTISLHVGESNDANLFMDILNIRDGPGVTSEPELDANPANDINDLSNVLFIRVWKDMGDCDNMEGVDRAVPGDNLYQPDNCDLLVYEGTLAGFADKTPVYNAVAAGTTEFVGFYWALPGESTGNEYQGDVTEFDVLFTAEQVLPEDLDGQCVE